MFGFVVIVMASPNFNANERKMAAVLKCRLDEVIELPIAPASELRELRQEFSGLVDAVAQTMARKRTRQSAARRRRRIRLAVFSSARSRFFSRQGGR
jgi:hypothetical protein